MYVESKIKCSQNTLFFFESFSTYLSTLESQINIRNTDEIFIGHTFIDGNKFAMFQTSQPEARASLFFLFNVLHFRHLQVLFVQNNKRGVEVISFSAFSFKADSKSKFAINFEPL